jgi:DNA-binding CsgD family transcriptional regulator
MTDAITALPFVGRERELRRLLARLALTGVGQGGVVLLAGEPGIGKTRTAEEFATAAEAQGARVLWGRCLEGEGAPAFWPWTQILRAYARTRDPDTLRRDLGDGGADLAEIAPVLRERLPDLPSLPQAAPDPSRFRLFDAATRLLWTLAAERPLVLILDDLHQADVPSLRLLEWVTRELDDARHAPDAPKLLVVGAYRDTEVDDAHPFTATLTELVRLSGSERLELTGLSEEEVARAITLSTERAAADLAATVHAETEGNPFFVVELLRLLAAEGMLHRTMPAGRVRVPPTVRAVIGRRLERLSPEARRLLATASVEGREFSLGVLGRVSGLDADRLLALIEEAETARVIVPVAETLDRYRFGHALIRETLYSGLPRTVRGRLHGQVGEALEAMTAADPEPHLAELAHHFVQAAAGDATKALMYARRAGDQALATSAYEEAVRHYELGLHALDVQATGDVEERESRRCDLLLALGQAQALTGSFERARESIIQAATLARRLPSAHLLARAALSLGLPYPYPGLVDQPAVALHEEVLERLGAGDDAMRARVMSSLAMALYAAPDVSARRTTLGAEAIGIARRLSDQRVLLEVLGKAYWAPAEPDQLSERLAIATELVEMADAAGLRDLAFYGRVLRWTDLAVLGDIMTLDRDIAACERLTRELRQPYSDTILATIQFMRATLAGRFAEADRLLATAPARIGRVQDPWTAAATLICRLPRSLEQNRERELLEEIDGLIAQGFARHHPLLRYVRLLVLTRLGRDADAAGELDTLAAEDFRDLPRDYTTLFCLALLAAVCARLQDRVRAGALYALLLPYGSWFINAGGCFLGASAHYLGLLAVTVDRWDDAVRHFEAALVNNGRIGARPSLAWAQHDYAAALLRRASEERATRNEERARARALLDEARGTARELDMPRLTADIDRLLAEVSAEAATFRLPHSAFPDRLTAREFEILRLLAQRFSNNEIAADLVLSVRTVERHIANIYAKTGIHARRDARDYLARHGLL